MNRATAAAGWRRRAQPLLGTLVEIGILTTRRESEAAFDAAFSRLREIQRRLSRFEADSDLSRFHSLGRGDRMAMSRPLRDVLVAAGDLRDATGGRFDVSLGSSPEGWRCHDGELLKLDAATRLDLGGIGKGYAVDRAVAELEREGCAAGWVNAGGDLRVFGDVDIPVLLRDESSGGVRAFASLRDGAFATSHFDADSRSWLAWKDRAGAARAHVSVAAPECLWADALTKVVATSGDVADPLLARHGAAAWFH